MPTLRTKQQTEKALAVLMERYDAEVQAIADHVRETRVVPACRRIGGSFDSGMGTFGFYDRNGEPIMKWDAKRFDLLAIYETLDIEVYGQHCLGTWVSAVERES